MKNAFVESTLERGNDFLARSRSRMRREWLLERVRTHRFGYTRRSSAGTVRALFITHDHRISHAQVHPFFYYRREILARFGWEFRQRTMAGFLAQPSPADEADLVFVQPWFELGADGISRLLDEVARRCRPSKVVFLDSFAPTDLRFASLLADRVDVYVKKHVLRNRGQYQDPVIGDTTLTDYFARRYALELPTSRFDVPERFLDKLLVGPSFPTDDWAMEVLLAGKYVHHVKHWDVHARLGSGGARWYELMRREAEEKIRSIAGIKPVVGFGAARRQYLKELEGSRLCFSPFGYGEVAWRDYEAVVCGAVLVKPDMGHCETNPNVFVPDETYVPVRWDLADLEEKVRSVLSRPQECERLARNAFAVLTSYFAERRFVDQLAPAISLG